MLRQFAVAYRTADARKAIRLFALMNSSDYTADEQTLGTLESRAA